MKIFIYGEIGYEVNSADMVKQISEAPEDESIDVYINSPGGNVYEGFAIFNALQRVRSRVTTHIDGLAFSAASWIAQAAKPGNRMMSPAAQYGIHKSLAFAGGNSDDLKDQQEILEKIDSIQISIYKESTGLDEEQIKAIMDEGKPLSINEALKYGFVDKEESAQKLAAIFKLNTTMDFKEQLKAFGEMLTGKENETSKALKDKVKEETAEAIEKAETVKQALFAQFTPAEEFKAFQEAIEKYIELTSKFIESQPKTDEIKEWIEANVRASMRIALDEIHSKGSIPAAAETHFNDEKKDEQFDLGEVSIADLFTKPEKK